PIAMSPFMPSAIPNGGRSGSMHAAHMSGKGFTTWGAGMGLDLNHPGGGTRASLDASKYKGVTFWAMAGAGATTSLRVNFPDKDTDPSGGTCGTKCQDHFGAVLTLSSSWTQQTIQFSDLKQQGWGTAAASFDAKSAYGVEFMVPANTTFDLWID